VEKDKAMFEEERENLNKFRGLERNKHITQHLLTISQGKRYYIIFPWAEGGDLTKFWIDKSPNSRTPQLVLWCLKQMLGLVEALNALHNQIGDNLKLICPHNDPDCRKCDPNCRHGDLKPGNILHFLTGEKEEGILKIADFGISKVHIDGTFERSETVTRATTPSYEAPEGSPSFPKGPRSRKYDIWSLGCIFLEFTIWIVRRWDEVQCFEDSRKIESDKQWAKKYAHFYQITEGTTPVAHVHQEVTKKITDLKETAQITEGTALGDLLGIIESKLLKVAVEDRYDARGLYKQLETIVQRATSEPVYLSSNMNIALS
jgi:serine/threonine protein kinase